MICVEWGTATSAGAVRTLNEDNFVATGRVFVVADGMGGHEAGEVASAIAADEFSRLAERAEIDPAALLAAVENANDRILNRGERDAGTNGLGTTVAGIAAVSHGGVDHWAAFNVGDSRVYRMADGVLSRLTVDHTEVEELVAAGRITRAEARAHARRHVVTRVLGSDPVPPVDTWLLPVRTGDRFLVCSDGVPGELADEEIRNELARAGTPQRVADSVVAAAVAAGGHDNATAIVIDVLDAGGRTDMDADTVPRVTAP